MKLPVVLFCLFIALAVSPAADVYLFAGQSNMWGTGNQAADLPADIVGVQKDILIFKSPPSVPKEGWYPLENGRNNNYEGQAWAAEAQLMPLLASAAKDKPIYLYKSSVGGSALAQKENEADWNAASEGELLDHFLEGIRRVKANLEAEGKTPRFRALVWMQGESECCHFASEAGAYKDNLYALIAKVREAAGDPELPVYLGRIHRHYAQPFLHIVRAQQALAAAEGKNIFMFDTDDDALLQDNIHFAAAGHVANGKSIFDLMTGKAKAEPAKIAPGQSFSVREFSGPGTPVGRVRLSAPGAPSPTFVVEGGAFEINPETGDLHVKDLSALKSSAPVMVAVRAINGASPTASGTVTVQFAKSDDKIAGLYAMIDPSVPADCVVVDGGYQEIRDAADAGRKYVAPEARKRPIQDNFPGTTKAALRFDGTKIMIGPASNTFLKPGEDADFTIAAVVHIPAHALTSTGWCLMINKGVEPALGIGYNYAENKFIFVYANPFNGALQTMMSNVAIQPGTSHVVRMRKVAETCRLYIDGALAGENKEKARPAILAEGQGAGIGLGGAFPPSPSFTGHIGKFYLVKGIPTTEEEARMDRDLAQWGGIK